MNSWFPSLPGNLIVWSVIRGTEKRNSGHAAPKDSKHISIIPVSRDHDNRNNSIKRSGILFSRTDRGGYRGNINWERCGVIVAVDTTKIDIMCHLNRERFNTGGTWRLRERTSETQTKKRNRERWRLTALVSHYEEDIQPLHMTISTVYWEEREAHREQANIATLTGTTSSYFLIFYGSFFIYKTNRAVRMSMTNSESWRWRVWIAHFVQRSKAWGHSIHKEIQQRRWNVASESSVFGSPECFLIWLFFNNRMSDWSTLCFR